MSAALVSVIGPPAVGKTTLAELLAREMPAELLLEDYLGNPFLAESYCGSSESRLPGQVYFLMHRAGQLSALWRAEGLAVSDYGFCQDRIFAELRLEGEEFRLYERIARRVRGLIPEPGAVIALDAQPELLLERIARRGRQFERSFDGPFLDDLRRRYGRAAEGMRCPVIRIDCGKIDLLDAGFRAALASQIRQAVGVSGRAAGR